jgi:hypothetical protein
LADKKIPAARIREVWLDLSLTTQEAAETVGLKGRGPLQRRAKALGLPPRPKGRAPSTDPEIFEPLWRAGVSLAEMAQVFDCHPMTIHHTSRRMNLPSRRAGGHQISLTVRGMIMDIQAARMAQTARTEQAAFLGAEMADKVDHRYVGAP